MKLNLSCPDEVTRKLDEYVDGIQFRNRTQLIRWILSSWLDTMNAQDQNIEPKHLCPKCKAPEIEALTPRTFYECGSSEYDERPETFKQSYNCHKKELEIYHCHEKELEICGPKKLR